MTKTPDVSNVDTHEEAIYGSGTSIVSPGFTPDTVHRSVVAMFSDPSDLLQTEGVSAESTTEGQVQSKRLSPEENAELLRILEQRFQTPNSCRPKGDTFANVKQIFEEDPDRAYKVYVAEVHLGAEMDYVECTDGKSRFTDLRTETNVGQNVAFLRGIAAEEREEAIQSLCNQYPNIPADAFDRLPNDNRGPNKWEGLLIEKVLQLESMPEADYRALQAKLPREKWLDKDGISWLEASKEQLASGGAPIGDRRGGVVFVRGGSADFRSVIRGVRVRV